MIALQSGFGWKSAPRTPHRVAKLSGVGKPHRDAALINAVHVLGRRLELLWPATSSGNEADFLAVIEQMDEAVKSFSATIGIARRSGRQRLAAASAKAAADLASLELKSAA